MATDEMLVRAAIKDELSGPLEKIRDELRRTAKETGNAGAKANLGARGFDKMAAGAGRFVKAGVGMAAKAAVAGVTALTVAVAAGSVKVLQWASDANEAASAFRTVFKGVAGDVDGYLDRLNKRFGIARIELDKAATAFGVFGKAAGISKKDLGAFTKDLTGAGLDLASFYNADPSEVFLALKSGLAGEAEPLRQFGIFLSDAAMKAEAATQGLTGELTESQKVMLRQRIIMRSLGDAEGDLERTKDGLANKTKALKGRMQDLGTMIGDRLRPKAEELAAVLDKKLGRTLRRLPETLDRVEASARFMYDAMRAGNTGAVVAKLDAMTGAGGKLTDAWEAAKGIAADLGKIVTGVLVPAFSDASGATGGLSSPLGLLRDALGFVADHTTAARRLLVALVVTLTAAKVITLGVAAATKIKAAADAIALVWLKAHTVGTKTHLVVSKAIRVATLAWAGAQKVLNLAMKANPIGLVITVLAALVTALILAYKKSETFRRIVDAAVDGIAAAWRWLWNSILAPIFRFLVNGIATIMDKFGDMLETMSHVPGFGWAKDAADKMHGAAAKARELADGIRDIPDRDVKITITPPSAAQLARVDSMLNRGGTPIGDTATSKARGGNLANTFATHAATVAATGTRPTITNVGIGGGGKGRGSGDHQNGRALDLQGKGLHKYGAHIRALGGYAAFHGTGSARHLHAVPPAMGDTATSRARPRANTGSSRTPAPVVIGAGAIVVQNPGANVDVERAVAAGIEAYLRDQAERS